MSTEEELRKQEIDRYKKIYPKDTTYKMGKLRMIEAKKALQEQPYRGSYLDVGCGRGEMLDYAKALGFSVVHGTEVVPELEIMGMVTMASVDNLPFNTNWFQVVSMFDVIEHLNEFDLIPACNELQRVASDRVIITASNVPSIEDGVDLHITKKSYEEWDEFFQGIFCGDVEWRKDLSCRINETWVVHQ